MTMASDIAHGDEFFVLFHLDPDKRGAVIQLKQLALVTRSDGSIWFENRFDEMNARESTTNTGQIGANLSAQAR